MIKRHEVDGVTLAVRSWPCREAGWPPVVLLPGTGATVMAAIGAPTLVIGGGTSSFLPQEHVAELARIVAHGTCVTIDAGHLVHATKPRAFLAELTTFLNS